VVIYKRGDVMEKKIIELSKMEDGYTCIICDKREATTRVRINKTTHKENVIGFCVCDGCLATMQKDIERMPI
jgi:transcription elongation factor Elf1